MTRGNLELYEALREIDEILADREPEDEEEELRDLIDRAERLLEHVDNVEYELVEVIREGYGQ